VTLKTEKDTFGKPSKVKIKRKQRLTTHISH
jgi:hypothetical protein